MKNKTKTPDVQGLLAKIVETKTKMENPKLAAGARRVLGLALIILVAAFTKACKKDPDPPKQLTGTVNISGKMEVGEQATANITGSNGPSGKFTYQWTRTPDGSSAIIEIIGADEKHYIITPADVGHRLGAIVGNADSEFTGTRSGTSAEKVKFGGRTEPLQIGGGDDVVNITLEYRTVDTTSLAKIQNAVALFQTAFNGGSPSHEGTIDALINEGVGGYKIVVDYDNDFDGFVPSSNNTLKVSKDWLDTNPSFSGVTLRSALDDMLEFVPPAPAPMIGKAPVPQYNRAMQLRDNRIASRQT